MTEKGDVIYMDRAKNNEELIRWVSLVLVLFFRFSFFCCFVSFFLLGCLAACLLASCCR